MLSALRKYLFVSRSKKKSETCRSRVDFEKKSKAGEDYDVEEDEGGSLLSESWMTVDSEEDRLEAADRKRSPAVEEKSKHERSYSDIDNHSGRRSAIRRAVTRFKLGPKQEYVVQEDISNGREHFKIPAISYRRNDQAPMNYHYVVDHVQWDSVDVDISLKNISRCNCTTDCSTGTCDCSYYDGKNRRYNSKGRLNPLFNLESPELMRECNVACGCNPKSCKNMVIQRGARCQVVLFRTRSRGWGVRTLENLKRGTFVGVYSGELLSSQRSSEREDDTYLFDLANRYASQPEPEADVAQAEGGAVIEPSEATAEEEDNKAVLDQEKTEEQPEEESATKQDKSGRNFFVCDAKYFGNYTRFINHSCEPNVIGIKSFTVHQDYRFPHIAFFTNCDIPANTELTLNYGDNYWLVKCKRDRVYCLCKRPNCRFSRKTFAATLKQYNEKRKRKS